MKRKKKKKKKELTDRDRTRTCNPQIRSLMPYPLGHTAVDMERVEISKFENRRTSINTKARVSNSFLTTIEPF